MPNSPFKKAVAAAKGSAPDGAMTLDLDEGSDPPQAQSNEHPDAPPTKGRRSSFKGSAGTGVKDDQDRMGKILGLRG